MTGVQLIGINAVLSRFEYFETDAWALYQGKQFIVSGVGPDSLSDWLNSFDTSGSTATYTLRVYDSDQAPTCATGNAGYIACLNFKLKDTYDGQGIAGHNKKLMDRIEALEKGKDDDDDEGDINSILMGYLESPEKLGTVIGLVRQMFGGAAPVMPAAMAATPLQTISGVGNSEAAVESAEQKLTRLAGALDKLERCDPKLIDHLEKLAQLGESDPLLFKAVISKLDAL